MNRKDRRAAQSKSDDKAAIDFRGKSYALQEAHSLAITEHTQGNSQTAVAIYNLIIAKIPTSADAYNNMGIILKDLNRYDDALAHFEKAIECNPAFITAHNNRRLLLLAMKRYDNALSCCDIILAINPADADMHNQRGIILHELRRYEEALRSYDAAIALNPLFADAYNNRGNTLDKIRQYEAAIECYDKACALKPDYAEAYYNRGLSLRDVKRYEESLSSLTKAYSLNPDIPYLAGHLLTDHMRLCQWQEVDQMLEKIAKDIDAGKVVCTPFEASVMELTLAQQKRCAEIHVQNRFPLKLAPLWNGEQYSHDKIRLGYFSADFHDHATAQLMVELFELHDRSQFEVVAFSFGPPIHDHMRERLEKAFDLFIDLNDKTDAEIAIRARSMEIDIAIDLKGFTKYSRPGIFAFRPTPVQVNYLGYPGTMGAECMDYLLADSIIIPKEQRQYYTEKITYLPDSYQVNDSSRNISEKIFTRQDVSLPENGFVFCCFNNSYKITPYVFDVWMRLLHKVDGSILWLLEDTPAAAANLRKEANARGINANRLVFAPRLNLADHLARHRLADLFLDTLPCNAHTTASDALWAGLPVLTHLGETFAGRVAASLLEALDLPELVTHSYTEYEALALELAADAQKLGDLRSKLKNNRTSYPLFDTRSFTKHIENAYLKMVKKAGV